jgi:hypothetical protein
MYARFLVVSVMVGLLAAPVSAQDYCEASVFYGWAIVVEGARTGRCRTVQLNGGQPVCVEPGPVCKDVKGDHSKPVEGWRFAVAGARRSR